MKNHKKILLTLMAALVVLSGCSSAPERMEKFNYEPNYPVNIPEKNLSKNGSLYHPGDALSLFDDSRAHKVGDIITIELNESFNAKKKDEAKYEKSDEVDYGVATPFTLFGQTPTSPVSAPFASAAATPSLSVGYGNNSKFKGKSDVKQNSSLTGAIAVTVVEVIPNGNLVIRGEKWITIHEGEEVIRFGGVIRPQDIRPDNTIDSEKVADVRLIYKDIGVSGDVNRPGAATKFIHKYWPF